MQNRILKLSAEPEQIGPIALGLERGHVGRCFTLRTLERDGGLARCTVHLHFDKRVGDRTIIAERARQRAQCNATRDVGLAGSCREFPRALGDRFVEFRVGHDLIHQPPLDSALALDPLLDRAEDIGSVASDLALVGNAREPTGSGQHGKQRNLRQRHGGGAIVSQHDVVAGERELVPTARRRPL